VARMIVMFDIDGVLADFISAYTALGSEMFPGRIERQRTEDRESWHELNGPHDDKIWNFIKHSPLWWTTLPLLVDQATMVAIDSLGIDHDVYFTTARVGNRPKVQTEQWLEKHGVSSPTVVVTEKKGEAAQVLGAHYCIDDKAGNAVAVSYLSKGTKSYLLDRKYNRLDHTVIGGRVKRVRSVGEYLADVHAAAQ
jgi:uncharacterized HAD superfamily protein